MQRRVCDSARPSGLLSRPARGPHVSLRHCVARAASEAPVDSGVYTGDTPGTVYGERGEVEKVRTAGMASSFGTYLIS